MKGLRKNTATAIEWLGLFAAALEDHPDGLFSAEMRAWYVARGEPIDGCYPGRGDVEGDRALAESLGQSVEIFRRFGLIRTEFNFPDRVYPSIANSRFPLHREHQVFLSNRGRRIATAPLWRQELFFMPRFAWMELQPTVKKLRTPLTVFSGCLAVIKMFLNWDNIHATAAALVAGVATALVTLIHPHNH